MKNNARKWSRQCIRLGCSEKVLQHAAKGVALARALATADEDTRRGADILIEPWVIPERHVILCMQGDRHLGTIATKETVLTKRR